MSLVFFLTSCKKSEETTPKEEPYIPTPYNLVIPEGFPEMIIPDNNKLTEEGVALGRMLFYDPII